MVILASRKRRDGRHAASSLLLAASLLVPCCRQSASVAERASVPELAPWVPEPQLGTSAGAPAETRVAFDYVMGAESARREFLVRMAEPGASELSSRGGRLLVRGRSGALLLHDEMLRGDFEGSLSVVLEAGALLGFGLVSPSGTELLALVEGSSGRDGRPVGGPAPITLRLVAGEPVVVLASSSEPVAAGRPLHLRLEWSRGEARLSLDGRTLARAPLRGLGAYRLALAAPRGGIELRGLKFSAARSDGPARGDWLAALPGLRAGGRRPGGPSGATRPATEQPLDAAHAHARRRPGPSES